MPNRLPSPVPPDLLRRAIQILVSQGQVDGHDESVLSDQKDRLRDQLNQLLAELGTDPKITVDLFYRAVGLINHLDIEHDEFTAVDDDTVEVAARLPMQSPEIDGELPAFDPQQFESARLGG